MNKIALVCNSFFEGVVSFVAGSLETVIPTFWGLLLLSLVVGCVLAVIYGQLVNQEKVLKIKNSIHGYINEAVLYRHDPLLTFKAQGLLLFAGLRYLTSSFLPLLILTIPSLIIFAALQTYYGYNSVREARDAELIISVSEGESPFNYSVRTEPEAAISPPLRIPAENQLVYKLVEPAAIFLADKAGTNETDISSLVVARSPEAMTSFWIETIFYGSSQELPRGIGSIFISKPIRSYSLFGTEFPWYVWSVVFILLGGFGAAKIFKITF